MCIYIYIISLSLHRHLGDVYVYTIFIIYLFMYLFVSFVWLSICLFINMYYMLFSIIYLCVYFYFFIYAFIYLCLIHVCGYVFILRTKKKSAHLNTKKVLFSNWVSYIMLYHAISKLPFLVTTCSRASTPIRTCGIKVLSSAVRTSALRTTNHSRPAQALFPWKPGKLGKPLVNHRQLP